MEYKYLILGHFLKGNFLKFSIEQKDLITLKERECDWVIDLQQLRYFDAKDNKWVQFEETGDEV